MGNLGTHAASLGIYENLAYDPRTDFEPIMLVASTPMVLVTARSLPVHTLNEVIAYAKANKGKTTMGSAGIGSISHLTLLLFNHLTGADVTARAVSRTVRGRATICSAARSTRCSIRSSPRRRIFSAAAKSRSWSPSRSARRPFRTCRRPTRPDCRSCKPWPGRRLFVPKGTPAADHRARQRRRAKAMEDPSSPSGWPKSAPTFRRPSSARRRRSRKLVNAEVDKWVPLIKAAGVVAQ